MAQSIFIDQELVITATDAQGRDMDALTLRVDYWKPTNHTNTPSGVISSGSVATSAGSPIVTITIAKDILDEPSTKTEKWRVQITDTATEVAWSVEGSGNAMCFDVYNRGKCK